MEIIETIRVTKAFGRKPGNLEMLWFLRDQAERRMAEHLSGEDCTPDQWAAVNTPDEAWNADNPHRPPAEWLTFKAQWFSEMETLAALAQVARRNVRIATGHEPIGKMVCRP